MKGRKPLCPSGRCCCWAWPGLVGAEAVVDDVVVLVDATLHLGLAAAREEGEGCRSKERCGDLG